MHNISIANFDAYLTESVKQHSDLYQEKQKAWASSTGRGFVNEIHIRSGLNLLIEKFDFKKPIESIMEVRTSPAEIFFCISGKLNGYAEKINKNLTIDMGNASFFLTPTLKCTTIISSAAPLKLITIRFLPEILCSEVCGLSNIFPAQMSSSVILNYENFIINTVPITSDMKIAIFQILNCPYNDAFRRVYLECKVIELILLYFASLRKIQTIVTFNLPAFTSKDIENINHAKQLLTSNLENPPALCELARQVGMNKDKLNQGFQKLFGTSVFAFFFQKRMEEAKKLLENNDMCVTEVAYAVGYSQPGTFSRAFKQHFGINPKAYRQRLPTDM